MPLRVMIVDSRPDRREAISPTLTQEGFEVVSFVDSSDDLARAVAKHSPDVILIDIDSPSRDTLESLRAVSANRPRPMVMFTQDDAEESIRRAIEAGVTAYIVDGIESRRVRPIVDAAMASFKHFRALEQELEATRSKLAERKLIERAKGIIMKQQGLSEPEAFQAMRNLAMRKNRKLVEIADSVISAAELLS